MPKNVSTQYKETGNVSFVATAAVIGKRFLRISGDRTGGPGLSDDLRNLYRMAHATGADRVSGVSKYDVALDDEGGVHGQPGQIVAVTAGAPIAAGQRVQSDAVGQAVPLGAGVAASRVTGVIANNNAIRWTARRLGAAGNSVRVQLRNAGAAQALSVNTAGDDIIVTLATDAGGVITSTASQVNAAVLEHDAASQLVTAQNEGASTGAGLAAVDALTALAGGADGGVEAGLAMSGAAAATDAQIKLR